MERKKDGGVARGRQDHVGFQPTSPAEPTSHRVLIESGHGRFHDDVSFTCTVHTHTYIYTAIHTQIYTYVYDTPCQVRRSSYLSIYYVGSNLRGTQVYVGAHGTCARDCKFSFPTLLYLPTFCSFPFAPHPPLVIFLFEPYQAVLSARCIE